MVAIVVAAASLPYSFCPPDPIDPIALRWDLGGTAGLISSTMLLRALLCFRIADRLSLGVGMTAGSDVSSCACGSSAPTAGKSTVRTSSQSIS